MKRMALSAAVGIVVGVVAGAALGVRAEGGRPVQPDPPGPVPGPVPAAAHAFVLGFGELQEQLGTEVMGFPVEDEHPAHDADAVQRTTTGLAVYRRGEAPSFTNGAETFTLKPALQVASVPAASSRLERLAECIIFRESRGYAGAVNPRSGASGLGQFLRSTWLSTPQGRAGLSVFDPVANRSAVLWMLSVGRGREFATIGGC